ncbi:MAG TPA: DUF333 domain-containing protein [Candidatus Micrarchaeota archaeon]|nr:DUF333 domain-containing protein [Candidatus Micrarchaeota archaeon]
MDRKFLLFSIAAAAIFSMALLAGCAGAGGQEQNPPGAQNGTYTLENSFDIAKAWIEAGPTYSFDGSGLKYVSSSGQFRCPYCFSYNFTFTSSHAGYGNRGGQALAQVITQHEIEVIVNNGIVESAVIDNVWDEMGSKYLSGEGAQQPAAPADNSSQGQTAANASGNSTAPTTPTSPAQTQPQQPAGQEPGNAATYASSLKAATAYVARTSTFGPDSYDLQFLSSDTYACDLCWTFRFSYTSPSAGYGQDRDPNSTKETAHTIEVITGNGTVMSAIVDGKYDEVSQRMLGNAGIANPASQNCVDKGFNLSIVADATGNEYGECSKPGYSTCEEWVFFKGECLIVPTCNSTSVCSANSSCYYYRPCQKLPDGTTSCGMERGDSTCHANCDSDSDCTGGLACREVTINAPEATTIVKMCLWPSEGKFCGGLAGFPCPDGYACKLDGDYPDASGTCSKIG